MPERGTYADLTLAKTMLSISDIVDDARLARLLESASRRVDLDTGRKFFVSQLTRYATAYQYDAITVPDLLSVSALHTDDGSRAYATEWLTTDYETIASESEPDRYPRWQIVATPESTRSFPVGLRRGVRITGQWGYGDGQSASPWSASGATLTVATAAATSVTVSSTTPFAVGQTILCESEQLYVTAIGTGALTVERSVNGTTAAIHAVAAVSIAQYPRDIVDATLARAEIDLRIPITGTAGGDVGTVGTGPAYARYRGLVEAYRLPGVA
jgi:hypothetical protein